MVILHQHREFSRQTFWKMEVLGGQLGWTRRVDDAVLALLLRLDIMESVSLRVGESASLNGEPRPNHWRYKQTLI